MTRSRLDRRKPSSFNLFLFYSITFIYLEFLFKIFTTGNIQIKDILLIVIFSISFATIFYILTNILKNKGSYMVSIIFTGITTFLFASQLIYYKIFKVFYTIYSAGNASQVFEFWREIVTAISQNILSMVLIFIPLIILILGKRKFFPLRVFKIRFQLVLLLCILIIHILGVGIIHMSGKGPNTTYDLYYHTNFPLLSIEKLGLITTMRLDIQRHLTGWTPSLNTVTPEPNDQNPIEEEEDPIEYNVMDIDFDKLISEETDEEIIKMHKYFRDVQPTPMNDYTGKFQGYNLIMITAEGFSPYAIHQEATPTLYKMVHEGYHFTNFYNPIWEVSTSDGEYVACTGLIPKSSVWSFYESGSNKMPFVMGNQLKKLGYKTIAYHNHTYNYYKRHVSHPNMGYEYKGVGNGLKVKKVWPASDLEMLENTIPEYIDEQPFHAYYMTVSGHLRYTFTGNSMAAKNREVVKDLPYSENAKAYIATQVELDRAMRHLLDQLEKAGIADRTLIAISADHYPYGLAEHEINELAGHEVEKNFELYKSSFILYTQNMEPEIIDKPCSSLDIIPTISNLMGLEYDSRLLMGRDIFSDSDPLVIFLNRSFITEKGRYHASENKFIPEDGVEADEVYKNRITSMVNAKFYYSAKILETDYYSRIFKN